MAARLTYFTAHSICNTAPASSMRSRGIRSTHAGVLCRQHGRESGARAEVGTRSGRTTQRDLGWMTKSMSFTVCTVALHSEKFSIRQTHEHSSTDKHTISRTLSGSVKPHQISPQIAELPKEPPHGSRLEHLRALRERSCCCFDCGTGRTPAAPTPPPHRRPHCRSCVDRRCGRKDQ